MRATSEIGNASTRPQQENARVWRDGAAIGDGYEPAELARQTQERLGIVACAEDPQARPGGAVVDPNPRPTSQSIVCRTNCMRSRERSTRQISPVRLSCRSDRCEAILHRRSSEHSMSRCRRHRESLRWPMAARMKCCLECVSSGRAVAAPLQQDDRQRLRSRSRMAYRHRLLRRVALHHRPRLGQPPGALCDLGFEASAAHRACAAAVLAQSTCAHPACDSWGRPRPRPWPARSLPLRLPVHATAAECVRESVMNSCSRSRFQQSSTPAGSRCAPAVRAPARRSRDRPLR